MLRQKMQGAEITMALSVCYKLVTNETVLISEDIII